MFQPDSNLAPGPVSRRAIHALGDFVEIRHLDQRFKLPRKRRRAEVGADKDRAPRAPLPACDQGERFDACRMIDAYLGIYSRAIPNRW